MKKLFAVLCLLSSVLFYSQAFAEPWAVVGTGLDTNNAASSGAIQTVDLATKKVYGPFLEGKLSPTIYDGVYDVAMLPDGNAIVSAPDFNSHTGQLSLIDLTDPTHPKLAASLALTFAPEDIYVAPMADVAIVTDGNTATGRQVAFINLDTFTINTTIADIGFRAEAIAISPDDIVLFASVNTNEIWYGRLNNTHDGFASPLQSILLQDAGAFTMRPANIAISPNGATALVTGGYSGTGAAMNVLKIATDGSGDVYPGNPFFLYNVGGTTTAGAMFLDDSLAYVTSVNGPAADVLTRVMIVNPGSAPKVKKDTTFGKVKLASKSTGWYYGVDTLALAHDGSVAVLGAESGVPAAFNKLSYVDLATKTLTKISLKTAANPHGVAIIGGAGQFNIQPE